MGIEKGVDTGVDAGVDAGVKVRVEVGLRLGVEVGVKVGVATGVEVGGRSRAESALDKPVVADRSFHWRGGPGARSHLELKAGKPYFFDGIQRLTACASPDHDAKLPVL